MGLDARVALYAMGFDDARIAKVLGYAAGSIANWRQEWGLPGPDKVRTVAEALGARPIDAILRLRKPTYSRTAKRLKPAWQKVLFRGTIATRLSKMRRELRTS